MLCSRFGCKTLISVEYLETYVMYVVLGVMLPVEHCTGGCDARDSEAASLQKFCAKINLKNALDGRLRNSQEYLTKIFGLHKHGSTGYMLLG